MRMFNMFALSCSAVQSGILEVQLHVPVSVTTTDSSSEYRLQVTTHPYNDYKTHKNMQTHPLCIISRR